MKKISTALLLLSFIISIPTLSFSYAQTSPLRVIATYPSMGERNARGMIQVSATFSNPMNPASITTNTFSVKENLGSAVSGTVTYGNNTATFIPFTTLAEDSTYAVTISGSVRDGYGNSLGSDYKWKFTVNER